MNNKPNNKYIRDVSKLSNNIQEKNINYYFFGAKNDRNKVILINALLSYLIMDSYHPLTLRVLLLLVPDNN